MKIFVFVVCFLFSNLVLAAGNPALYFRTTASEFSPDSTFTVGVFVNTEKPVNAFEIEIGYSVQNLEFLGFNANNSIVEFWRKDPENLDEGIIRLQGGLSGSGFAGRAGEIIKLNFRAKKEASAQWSFRLANVYYADGLGTLAKSEVSPMILPISSGAGEARLADEDTKKPNISKAGVVLNPVDNSSLLVFSADDEESGLRGTFIRSRKWFFWSNWQKAVNPVPLTAGVWSYELRAEDNNGNASRRIIYINEEVVLKLFYLSLVFIFLLIYYFVSQRKRKLL